MLAYILPIALIVGLLMYLLCSQAKAQEIGRILFFSAILSLLITLAPYTVKMMH